MWWSVLPQILGAAVLLLAPGLLVALALRFRGFDALGLAPALSVGIIVATSTLTPFLNVRYGLIPVVVTALAVAAVGMYASRRLPAVSSTGQQPADTPPGTWRRIAPFAAFGIAAVLVAVSTVKVIGAPQAFSQTYDAIFHLNSVKYALDTGQSSSLTIGAMTGGGFYPAGWNAAASLVASVTGADVTVAVNITSIILAAVFWPLGCLLLSRWIVGPNTAATLGTAIACASLGAFPVLMMDFGVLYPNLLAISILPAGVALVASLAGFGHLPVRRRLATLLALLLSLLGLVVAHPTTFMAWLAWTLPMVLVHVGRTYPAVWRDRNGGRLPLAKYSAAVSAYGVAFILLWVYLRPPEDASFWGPYHSIPQSIGEALTFSPMDLPPAWLVAPVALLGLWVCFRKYPHRFGWIGLAFLIFSSLFVVVAGFSESELRDFLTGVWYNDSYRVAALLPLVAVLLVGVGLDWAAAWLTAARARRPALRLAAEGPGHWPAAARRAYRAAVGTLLVLAAMALGQQGGLEKQVQQAATRYDLTEDSPLVSADELSLIQRLDRTVPPDDVLIGNPYTGAALSYALGNRRSAQLHILSSVSPAVEKIYESAASVSTDPSVCEAVRQENGYYLLDFGRKEIHGGNHTPAGLKNLDQNPGVQLVDRQGDAKLYKVSVCGQ
jgi:hypothetical protein